MPRLWKIYSKALYGKLDIGVLVWSPSLSDPNGPMGHLTHAPWSGAPQLIPSWWAPVAPRYKERWGPAARITRFTGRRHPTDKSNLADLVCARSAAGSFLRPSSTPSASTPSPRRDHTFGHREHERLRPDHPELLHYITMAGTSASAAALGHEGIPVPSPVSLSIPLCYLIKSIVQSISNLINAVADPYC
jgi:hypothetical protein